MTVASSWELDPERYQRACFSRFPGCYRTNDEAVLDADPTKGTVPVAFLTLQGDTSAREDLAGLRAAAADAPRGA